MIDHVRRGNKVDVMGAFLLKLKHLRRKFRDGKHADGVLLKLLADLEVLAKNTAQVTAGKEYGA